MTSRRFGSLSLLGALICLGVLAVSPANATLVGTIPTAPGTVVPPGNATGDAPGTFLADQVQPFTITTAVGVMSGSLQSAVYRESGGTLDFYYQLTNTSPDGDLLNRETDSNFVGFLTNTGFRLDGATLTGTTFTNGGSVYDQADRNLAGTVVGFTYNLFGSNDGIPVGGSSAVLVISTNATLFKVGTASAIDSGTATVPAYEPASTVPEPTSIALLGSVLLGFALVGRRRFCR